MVRTTKQFLADLFQGCTDGKITITTLPGAHCIHLPVAEVDKAAELIERLGQKQNTYYNLALRKDGLSDHNRGGEEDIHTVVAMCSDIDVKGAAHKQQALPESAEEVCDFLASLPIQPTYIIESGNGIHALWLLKEPYVITDHDSLLRIISISSGFGAYLMQEGKKRGWKLDPVQDITRMLRAPGTLNFKSDPPRECKTASFTDVRYPLSAFQEYKAELPMIEPVTVDPGSVGSAERMRGKCAFIDDCVDNAFNLPEPNWHAMISIVAMTEDGQAKAHEWSEPYYAYDAREVDAKVKRAIAAKKPCSCEYIRDHIGFDCPKEGCMNGDKVVRGPIAFAILSKEEQIERLLNGNLSLEDALDETNLALAAYAKENTPALYIRLKKMYQKLGVSVRDLEKSIAKEKADAKVDFFGTITLNDIDTAGLTLPDGWDLTMDGISHMEMSPMGAYINRVTTSPVLITRKLEDMDDGSEKLELAFYRNHRWKYIILPRGGVMDKGKILKAADMGFPVSSDNATSLVKFLSAFEAVNADAIPSNRSIDHVGWVRGLKEFYPYHMKGEVVFEGTSSEASRLVKSIHTAGDEQTWIDMAIRLRTMPFARTMLAASFASVLLEPLQQRIIYLHLWKDSRSGKTASQKAAVSIWGEAAGLLVSYNSTSVGFERTAAAMNHMPLALDELQSCTLKPEHFSRLIYMLGNGIGKMRGDKYGGTQEILHWRNVILSTGEQPIITGNSMDGVVTRVMELCAAPIEDEAFSASVHQICENNYGFAGERFVKWLFDNYVGNEMQLRNEYEEMKELLDFLYDICEGDAGLHLNNVALLCLADSLSSQAIFGVDKKTADNDALNLGIKILQCIHSQDKEDSIDRAWAFIVDWVKSNKMHFEIKRRLGSALEKAAVSPIYGRYLPETKQVCFIPTCFYNALKDGGFSVEKCYTGFKERGYIEVRQRKVRVDQDNPKTIISNIEIFDDSVEEDKGAVLEEDLDFLT
ncbi:MAG: DUF927 domain-containing protein [Oscillospiraceae bacterium]|nr:DUF927 domain-containing protein [Oscillospiraceae bacterium]